METDVKPNSRLDYLGAIFLMILFILGFYVYSTIAKPQIKEMVVLKAPDCPQSYESFKQLIDKGQYIDLVNDFSAYAAKGSFSAVKNINLIRSGEDEIACGYLYAKAVKDHKSIDKIDHIYINPNNFGGHIVASKSITLNNQPADNTIEFLLPLNAITYLPDNSPYDLNAQNFRIADWVKVLNASNQLSVQIASAIQNYEAKIENVKIVYKCWNKDTGQETGNCQLGTQ